MAYYKRSMKHRKSSRKHSKASRTRARRGGLTCSMCGQDKPSVTNPGEKCTLCSSKANGFRYNTR